MYTVTLSSELSPSPIIRNWQISPQYAYIGGIICLYILICLTLLCCKPLHTTVYVVTWQKGIYLSRRAAQKQQAPKSHGLQQQNSLVELLGTYRMRLAIAGKVSEIQQTATKML